MLSIKKEKGNYIGFIKWTTSTAQDEGNEVLDVEMFVSPQVYFLVDTKTFNLIDVNEKNKIYDSFELARQDFSEMGLDPNRIAIFFTKNAKEEDVAKAISLGSMVPLRPVKLVANKAGEFEV